MKTSSVNHKKIKEIIYQYILVYVILKLWSTSAYALRLADRYLEVEEKIDIIINAFSLYNKLVPDRTPESLD